MRPSPNHAIPGPDVTCIEMRTIIAGSRSLGYEAVCKAMDLCGWVPTVVISGTARGVDRAGEMWAYERHIPIERFPADWANLGRKAGYMRNVEMSEKAEAAVICWNGSSKGTKHMIDIAKRKGLRVFVSFGTE